MQSTIDDLDVGFLATDVSGDGGKIILTAGVPSNTGNDEERMLFALRRLSKEDLRIPIRMGVNRGPVFSGPVGPPRRRTYTVMGDTVNLAARVMAKASPGEVVATTGVLEESDTRLRDRSPRALHGQGEGETGRSPRRSGGGSGHAAAPPATRASRSSVGPRSWRCSSPRSAVPSIAAAR